jgi:alkanesulfonate monooxygenase SsuD/methylene tetrahydromethanopterin reductase-like flavin-dependent oxidoreductase (luciferase family)
MEFGILFTSQPHKDREPYPHRAVHARVTGEIVAADRLGFDTAWLAEHHFSTEYGIMPDVWVYAGHLAAVTERIRLGMAVVTLPLANPVRVVENAAFVDILSRGRVALGLGSGYRKYEFDGFGLDFEARRDMQDEALAILLDLFRAGRSMRKGRHFTTAIAGDYELLPQPIQKPYPPLFLAGATDRSIATAGRLGLGLMMSTLTPFDALAKQVRHYRANLEEASQEARANPGFGQVDIARWVYVAETDAQAKRDSQEGLLRHLKHFFGDHQSWLPRAGLTRQGLRRQRARLRHPSPLDDRSRLARDSGGAHSQAEGRNGRKLAYAALSALVRHGEGEGLPRAVRTRGDAPLQTAGESGRMRGPATPARAADAMRFSGAVGEGTRSAWAD